LKRGVRRAWTFIVVATLAISALLFAVVPAAAKVGAFALLWGLGVGGLLYRFRASAVAALARAGIKGFGGFVAVVIAVSVTEETVCAGFGCALAVPNYFVDLFVVVSMWVAWLSAWYFIIAPRYKFEFEEALLIAACTGVMFEVVGNGRAWGDPLGSTLGIPLVIVVYAAIVMLPMQMMPWKGEREGRAKPLIAFFVPYLAMLPVALAVFAIAAVAGWL